MMLHWISLPVASCLWVNHSHESISCIEVNSDSHGCKRAVFWVLEQRSSWIQTQKSFLIRAFLCLFVLQVLTAAVEMCSVVFTDTLMSITAPSTIKLMVLRKLGKKTRSSFVKKSQRSETAHGQPFRDNPFSPLTITRHIAQWTSEQYQRRPLNHTYHTGVLFSFVFFKQICFHYCSVWWCYRNLDLYNCIIF